MTWSEAHSRLRKLPALANAITASQRLLATLTDDLPPDRIEVTPKGTVSLEWRLSHGSVEHIEVWANGVAEISRVMDGRLCHVAEMNVWDSDSVLI